MHEMLIQEDQILAIFGVMITMLILDTIVNFSIWQKNHNRVRNI